MLVISMGDPIMAATSEAMTRDINLIKATMEGDLKTVMDLLSIDKALINQIRPHNHSLLLMAAHSNHLNIVQYLIYNGARINHYNNAGNNALAYAYNNNNVEMLKLLLASGAIGESIEDIKVDPHNKAQAVLF